MKINGGVRYVENGLTSSLRAMHLQSELVNISNENITGFDKVGYQRKDAVVSSFTEYIGVHGLSTTIDDKVGRVALTENPLDLAIASKGYFQTLTKDGMKLTRDGRFKLDNEGNLLTLDDGKVLSNSGMAIKLHVMPEKLSDVVVNSKGTVSVFNNESKKLEKVATLGIVDAAGSLIMHPEVKQGYNEYSNVSLESEFLGLMPTIRNFDANRQIFMIESQNLQKAIQQLGTVS